MVRFFVVKLVCVLVCTAGCSTLIDPSYCKYRKETDIREDATTSAGTVLESTRSYVGTYLARPVWVGSPMPAPGTLDELVIDVGVAEGRVHEFLDELDEEESDDWCPEHLLHAMLTLQIRNVDGSFWATRTDGSPDAHIKSYGVPGTYGPYGGGFPVQRHPPDWDEVVPVVEDWEFVHEYQVTTVAAWDYYGVLSGPAVSTIPVAIHAVYDHEEMEDLTGIRETVFSGHLWDLEPL